MPLIERSASVAISRPESGGEMVIEEVSALVYRWLGRRWTFSRGLMTKDPLFIVRAESSFLV